ncbi:MAG: hypothetical protein ACTSXJ_00285 [Candidatus Baldrarchaeia archaeon]
MGVSEKEVAKKAFTEVLSELGFRIEEPKVSGADVYAVNGDELYVILSDKWGEKVREEFKRFEELQGTVKRGYCAIVLYFDAQKSMLSERDLDDARREAALHRVNLIGFEVTGKKVFPIALSFKGAPDALVSRMMKDRLFEASIRHHATLYRKSSEK